MECERAALVGGRVRLAFLGWELVELIALVRDADARPVVGEIDLDRYQYSSHETTTFTTLGRGSDGRTDTTGIPSDRATPATVCGCSEELNSSTAEATFCSTLEGTARTCRGSWKPDPPTRPCSVVSCPRGGDDAADSLTSSTGDVVARSRDPESRLGRNRCRNERRRSDDFGGTSSYSGTVPSRAQPSFTARDLQSSQTDRRAPPLRYTSARSPRSSVRPHMSQAMGASDVLISPVLTGPEATDLIRPQAATLTSGGLETVRG